MIWLQLTAILVWTLALVVGWYVYRSMNGGAAVMRGARPGCAWPLFRRPEVLRSIETPCEAQAFLLVAVAKAGGALVRERRAVLEYQLREGVTCCDGSAERLIDRMAAITGVHRCARVNFERVTRALRKSVDRAELRRVQALITTVANAANGPTVDQFDLIARYNRICRL